MANQTLDPPSVAGFKRGDGSERGLGPGRHGSGVEVVGRPAFPRGTGLGLIHRLDEDDRFDVIRPAESSRPGTANTVVPIRPRPTFRPLDLDARLSPIQPPRPTFRVGGPRVRRWPEAHHCLAATGHDPCTGNFPPVRASARVVRGRTERGKGKAAGPRKRGTPGLNGACAEAFTPSAQGSFPGWNANSNRGGLRPRWRRFPCLWRTRVHVGAQSDAFAAAGPLPLSTPDHGRCRPNPRCTSMPHCVSLSATIPGRTDLFEADLGMRVQIPGGSRSVSSAKPSMRSMLGMSVIRWAGEGAAGERETPIWAAADEGRTVRLEANARPQTASTAGPR